MVREKIRNKLVYLDENFNGITSSHKGDNIESVFHDSAGQGLFTSVTTVVHHRSLQKTKINKNYIIQK